MGYDITSVLGSKSDEKQTTLVTRDFLGGLSSIETQELDLDSYVPFGWERHLDLKDCELQSGKVYIERCKSSVSEHKFQMNKVDPKIQDLNFPPSSSRVLLKPFKETSLDLKLASHSMPSSNCQSVCTVDKVKSALKRVEKNATPRKRFSPLNSSYLSSASVSYSSSSSSVRDTKDEDHEEKLSSPLAAGCPGCLSYVIIRKHNPICPICNSVIPSPLKKKPKIDLNVSLYDIGGN
ncbi:unnamed protein product [Sphenostylis stenocarpa]|uniref:Uncharacterized protein n=1 Tax=Sphenostylis stenocarpa TaxID=92480 RepID=A0AA86W5L9_9FABA|nr:unnamed protein product [Sphenostylis stenocarpa]